MAGRSLTTDSPTTEYSRKKSGFLLRTAKSVSEIQSNINNLADVLVFLEVLGYGANTVRENGFKDMRDLARQVYEVIDYYNPRSAKESSPLLYGCPASPGGSSRGSHWPPRS